MFVCVNFLAFLLKFFYNFVVKIEKGGEFPVKTSEVEGAIKCGTVTVSVYKDKSGRTFFIINTDNDEVLPVSYVIEDTLYLY